MILKWGIESDVYVAEIGDLHIWKLEQVNYTAFTDYMVIEAPNALENARVIRLRGDANRQPSGILHLGVAERRFEKTHNYSIKILRKGEILIEIVADHGA